MASEVRGGEVVRAWIWQPQHATAFVAERGAGAYRDGGGSSGPGRGGVRGVTSRRRWIGRALGDADLARPDLGVLRGRLPEAREGEADYALYGKGKPWDHAPASLLLGRGGGCVGTFDGSPRTPRGAPPGLVSAADRATYDLVQASSTTCRASDRRRRRLTRRTRERYIGPDDERDQRATHCRPVTSSVEGRRPVGRCGA